MRSKVEDKIKELIDLDIIEPVEGPTPWVNLVVVVPKSGGDIRLCIDMRRANEAIRRARHPIPTVDEITQSISGSKIFSKLDLKWGYHQLELSPESRKITTFATHCGLFRYKRLLFGVNSASEQYQYEIQTALAGIEGQENISDDIIIHGKDQEEHDSRLERVVKRLEERGLTPNAEKCQFSMDKLTFVGTVLSGNGISCTAEKVKAVTEAREPRTVSVNLYWYSLDYYSRYYEVDILKSTTTEKIISSLEVMFSRHGLPESLTSDNGPQFISAEFKECMEKQGIRHHRTTAKWPQANGQVECQNLSLLKRIQIVHAEKQDWKKELTKYLTAYQSLPHPTTGVSPAELLFGRKVRTKLPELSDVHIEHEVHNRDSEQKSKCKAYADARRNAS